MKKEYHWIELLSDPHVGLEAVARLNIFPAGVKSQPSGMLPATAYTEFLF